MRQSIPLYLLACFLLAAGGPLETNKRQLDSGTYVTDISQCPSVAPRTTPPKSVHDLRPDDFSVAMAVGDSITAGAFAQGINRENLLLNFVEFRGLSYAGGGDAGAITVPNIIKHYNKTLIGASKGVNLGIELCFGPLCPIGPVGWNQPVDQLNAAQSGALASNLLHEVRDYLVPQVKAAGIAANRFKYLSFQIGSNDLCQLCLAADALLGPGTQSDFEANIRETLEYVRKNIPNTLVNLFGVFQVSQIYGLTLNEPYCQQLIPNVTHYNLECTCALFSGEVGEFTRSRMDKLQGQYNTALKKIVADYKKKNYNDFAVIWQPPEVPLGRYPIESLSSLDCFHPSTATHQRIAAGLWNRLTLSETARASPFEWETTPKFRCLQENDRIKT
ncbi:Phospholipase B1, membrane-associated OS=Mus musculus GN=Plb1 PE=2 SV=2 [Rhizoctonia solani AG-1 IB]|uniref:Phospholipase B1, membrane-associated n=1 Tax=Thanatephorus cucumeris (strain AG1-IB / isolate 7/3/14) TaxID=1108050 RepID=A0A0B7FQD4_THACB|nr:Phospholipase B1, membrane-associated OS=Mus musculus GN=Plb1 PE=2 SV=2 [Rhizoctonia solani AG-1 IB]